MDRLGEDIEVTDRPEEPQKAEAMNRQESQ